MSSAIYRLAPYLSSTALLYTLKLFSPFLSIDLQRRGHLQHTLLHTAAYNGNYDLVQYLVEQQVDVNLVTVDGWNALHLACAGGYLDIVKLLLSSPHMMRNAETLDGWSYIHCAAAYGFLPVLKYLCEEQHMDCTLETYSGWQALHWAVFNGYTSIVMYLIQQREVDVQARINDGSTVLHLLCRAGHAQLLQQMLALVPSEFVHVRNDARLQAWQVAAREGHLSCVRLCVDTPPNLHKLAMKSEDIELALQLHMAHVQRSQQTRHVNQSLIDFLQEWHHQIDPDAPSLSSSIVPPSAATMLACSNVNAGRIDITQEGTEATPAPRSLFDSTVSSSSSSLPLPSRIVTSAPSPLPRINQAMLHTPAHVAQTVLAQSPLVSTRLVSVHGQIVVYKSWSLSIFPSGIDPIQAIQHLSIMQRHNAVRYMGYVEEERQIGVLRSYPSHTLDSLLSCNYSLLTPLQYLDMCRRIVKYCLELYRHDKVCHGALHARNIGISIVTPSVSPLTRLSSLSHISDYEVAVMDAAIWGWQIEQQQVWSREQNNGTETDVAARALPWTYMAPELVQYYSSLHAISTASPPITPQQWTIQQKQAADVFSIGLLAFQVCFGIDLFDSYTLSRYLSDLFPSSSSTAQPAWRLNIIPYLNDKQLDIAPLTNVLGEECVARFVDLIERCCSVSPNNRPTLSSLQQDLQAIIEQAYSQEREMQSQQCQIM